MPNIENADCVREMSDLETGSGSYLITLTKFPIKPYENNLYFHNGNPSINAFRCNTSMVESDQAVFCSIEDVIADGVPEYVECANHGMCDSVKGICTCNRGFHGPACDDISDYQDIEVITHDGPFFRGNVVRVEANRSPSSEFNLVNVRVDNRNITTIRGDGLLSHNGEMLVLDGTIMTSKRSQIGNPSPHLAGYHDGALVYLLDAAGSLSLFGGISAANGAFSVDQSSVKMTNAHILDSLNVKAPATFSGSINIERNAEKDIALNKAIAECADNDSENGNCPRDAQKEMNAPLLSLSSQSASTSSLITATVDGIPVLDLSSSGSLSLRNIKTLSGGIHIAAGGLNVDAGGINVSGGLTLRGGGLNLMDNEISASSLVANSDLDGGALISGKATSKNYAGSMIELQTSSNLSNDFGFFAGIDNTGTKVAEIHGDGSISSKGGATFTGPSGLTVSRHSSLNGGVSVSVLRLKADKVIGVPVSASFVIIEDDGSVQDNDLVLGTSEEGVSEGQLLILTNSDANPTTGDASLPSGVTLLLVFDGMKWIPIEALNAPIQHLSRVKSFEAENDIHIGNVTFSAGRLRASHMRKSAIPIVSSDGLLIDSEKFTFLKGVLSTPMIKFSKLLSDVDARGSIIKNVALLNAKVDDSIINAIELTVLDQQGLAFFDKGKLKGAAGVTLDGHGNIMIPSLHSDLNMNGNAIKNVSVVGGLLEGLSSLSVEGTVAMKNLPTYSSDRNINDFDPFPHFIVADRQGKLSQFPLSNPLSTKSLNTMELNVTGSASLGKYTNINEEGIVIGAGGTLILENLKSSNFLGTDESGRVVSRELILKNLRFDDISATSIQASSITTTAMTSDSLSSKSTLTDSMKADKVTATHITVDAVESKSLSVADIVSTSTLEAESISSKKMTVLNNFTAHTAHIEFLNVGNSIYSNGMLSSESVKANTLEVSNSLATSSLVADTMSVKDSLVAATITSMGKIRSREVHADTLYISPSLKDNEGNVLLDGKNNEPPGSKGSKEKKQGPIVALHADSEGRVFFSPVEEKRNDMDNLIVNHLLKAKTLQLSGLEDKGEVGDGVLWADESGHVKSSMLLRLNGKSESGETTVKVQADKLEVNGASDIFGPVYVGGSLSVHGSVVGSGPYIDSSDIRFKVDVSNITDALPLLNKLRVVRYQHDTANFPHLANGQHIGLIANEVEETFPEFVEEDELGYKGISYSKIGVIAVAALQEYQRNTDNKLQEMQNLLEQTKKENDELRTMVGELLQLVKGKQGLDI